MQKNVSLKPFNTFGIETKANFFVTVDSIEELKLALNWAKENQQALLILGGGSNILLIEDWKGLVIHNQIKGIEILEEDEEGITLLVGAGENWHNFVVHTIQKGWAGLENLSLIPGNVGAAPIQNIGAYGVEQEKCFVFLQATEIESGLSIQLSHQEMNFGYRESWMKKQGKGKYFITHVAYRLKKKNYTLHLDYGAIKQELANQKVANPTLADVSSAVISIRQSKLPDPKVTGNAGSFFKNPEIEQSLLTSLQTNYPEIPVFPTDNKAKVKIPAGWLIEKAGWKGYRNKEVGVHPLQALVLVNYGNASGKDIFDLSEQILEDVHQKFGITLEREVNIVSNSH